MTGNLNMMMKFRDMQVAEDIGKKAALGWFDVEFTMYGCVYLKNGQRAYRISPQSEDIYGFIEESAREDIFPSNVLSLTRKCAVPTGMKEEIALTVKKELAKRLQRIYPAEFLQLLAQTAEACRSNMASMVLWSEAEALEGLFEEEELQHFERLIHYCYSCRKLAKEDYGRLLAWLKEERASMTDDFVSKDIFEKTLYGLAYEEEGTIRYLSNAHSGHIYESLHELEGEGRIVTPILAQTYWYNYAYSLAEVKADFKAKLKQVYSQTDLARFKALREGLSPVDKETFAETLRFVREKWGELPAATLQRYGCRWGLH